MANAGVTSVDPVAAAHARLLADRTIQFAFSPRPPPPAPPPSWLVALLKAIGRLLQASAPAIRIAFWALLAAAVCVLAYVIVRQLTVAPERKSGERPLNLDAVGAGATAAARRAAALLADADRLAAEGLYGEAAHVLLLRGVDDVDHGRPGRIRPSSTSRDIAALPDLPPEPRAAFALIAQAVERAVFGGRPLDAAAWAACRDAYGALARPEAWAAR